jgi:hypothetical protein
MNEMIEMNQIIESLDRKSGGRCQCKTLHLNEKNEWKRWMNEMNDLSESLDRKSGDHCCQC